MAVLEMQEMAHLRPTSSRQTSGSGASLAHVGVLFGLDWAIPSESASERQLRFLQADRLNRDFGLRIASDLRHNSDSSFSEEDDLIYRWRYQVGLEWDLLGGGYLQNRRDSKLLYRGAELADRRHDFDRRLAHYPFLRNQIIRLFGEAKVKMLKQEKQFLERSLELEKRAYFAGFIPLEDVLGVERDLAVAETEIHNLQRFNTVFRPVGSGADSEGDWR